MSRKMISTSQLENMIRSAATPLYLHHIKLEKEDKTTGQVVVVAIDWPSSNDLKVDSIEDLDTLFGPVEKTIVYSIGYINWAGTFAKTTALSTYTKVSDIVEAI